MKLGEMLCLNQAGEGWHFGFQPALLGAIRRERLITAFFEMEESAALSMNRRLPARSWSAPVPWRFRSRRTLNSARGLARSKTLPRFLVPMRVPSTRRLSLTHETRPNSETPSSTAESKLSGAGLWTLDFGLVFTLKWFWRASSAF